MEPNKIMSIKANGDFPHLSKAPISEAIIDLRVTPIEPWHSDTLQGDIATKLPDYPIIEPQRQFRTNVTAKPDSMPETCTTDLGPYGYIFKTNDKLNIAQFRKDGFAFSRLEPYKDWNHLVTEAHRLWVIYSNCVSSGPINRLGVRFLNRIYAPQEGKIEEYFTDTPMPPQGIEATFLGFFHRDVLEIPGTIYSVLINRILKPEPQNKKMAFIIDIDVFTQSEDLSSEKIWGECLKDIHHIKNKIFFNSIQNAILEGMK